MPKQLTEAEIIRIMREEWDNRVSAALVELKDSLPSGEEGILSPELKVRHKKSGIRYTIDSIGPKDAILRTPEGKQILVGKDVLENEYEVS